MPRIQLDVESWMFDVGCSVFAFSAPPPPLLNCDKFPNEPKRATKTPPRHTAQQPQPPPAQNEPTAIPIRYHRGYH